MPEVSEEEIISVILSINNSAPGYDACLGYENCAHVYITLLPYLMNSSIKQRIFTDELNIVKVFHMFKAGDEQLITNNKPISVFSKILENLWETTLSTFWTITPFSTKSDMALEKDTLLIILVERVAKALDTGKIVAGVYLDIRKAILVLLNIINQ